MATTYTLIEAQTLTSDAASVTFSSIPGTFTDLVLRISARVNNAASTRELQVTFNSVGGTSYSSTYVDGNGSAATSARSSGYAYNILGSGNSDGSTANTYTSLEIYVPSYTANQFKSLSSFMTQENNSSAANTRAVANLFSNTNAITSITLLADGYNYFATSSFYLYGISNA